jgi:diguanylate cyclase (GGDEF)-like protein
MKSLAHVPFDETGRFAAMSRPASGWRAHVGRLTETRFLVPALMALVLGAIWIGTLNLIRVESVSAEAAATVSSVELLNTYEAQVVRALREIDQTLRLVKYVYETTGVTAGLTELMDRSLMPPEQLFIVQVVDKNGTVIASNRAAEPAATLGPDYTSALQGATESLWIGKPRKDPASQEWTLHFARRLNTSTGSYAGAVVLSVDAAYFVSAYEEAKLGKRGALGLLGTDGVFRIRRSGDTLSAGDHDDYANEVPSGAPDLAPEVSVRTNPWDGIVRYTLAQKLFGFPVAVVVGLSQEEQLASTRAKSHTYLWRASVSSVLLILIGTLLGRLSWQLARARERENEAKLAHAQRVEYLAYHDGLTALPNRSLFNKLLAQAIRQAPRFQRQVAIAFIDLDRFKQINDTLGHEAGDQLLQEVARRLKDCLREGDTVARLGGDEFVVLLSDLVATNHAATVAEKIVTAIARPFMLLGQEFRVTASIGISIYPNDGLDAQTLTKNADIAMYQAKEEGKNNFQFYSEKLNANSLERLTLESSLRHALERQEFQLHYQAKRDTASGEITGVEALLRWQHPDLGEVAPMQFIPVAEETGLIVPIGKWAIQTACRQSVEWREQGLPRIGMAVNLTARQFCDDNLLADISSILAATGMEPALLQIEIHESLLIQNVDRTLRTLTALKSMGIKIAIDDFGTGYSSLASLQRFPLDAIKIDRSFMRNLVPGSENRTVTEAIIAMGKTLSVTVVAQGVETKAQAEFLRDQACDEFQGFYFNRPVSAQALGELLRNSDLMTNVG